MARTRKYNDFPVLPASQLHRPLVLVVDMVNGFAKSGALADPDIAKIAPAIEKLLQLPEAKSVFICDAHSPDAREFESFPVHCLKGTEESRVIEELALYAGMVLEKNSTNAFMAPGFEDVLALLDEHPDVLLTGCCTDICVLHLGLALQTWLYEHDRKDVRVIVPADCVDTYHMDGIHDAPFWNETGLALMKASGIQVVSRIGE